MNMQDLEFSILFFTAIVIIGILYKKYVLLKDANRKLIKKLNRSYRLQKSSENIYLQELENYSSYINEIDGCKELIESSVKKGTSFHLN